MGMPNGRAYTVVVDGVTIPTAISDLAEITPAANKPVYLKGFEIAQKGTADVGDGQEEFIGWTLVRGHTTSGSGGAAPTPQLVGPGDSAASFTAETNNITIASGGTGAVIHSSAFNVRGNYIFWWPDGLEPCCSAAQNRMVIRAAAAADAVTASLTLYLIEAA